MSPIHGNFSSAVSTTSEMIPIPIQEKQTSSSSEIKTDTTPHVPINNEIYESYVPLCRFQINSEFTGQKCTRGEECKMSHDEHEIQKLKSSCSRFKKPKMVNGCYYYAHGYCRYGTACNYSHEETAWKEVKKNGCTVYTFYCIIDGCLSPSAFHYCKYHYNEYKKKRLDEK